MSSVKNTHILVHYKVVLCNKSDTIDQVGPLETSPNPETTINTHFRQENTQIRRTPHMRRHIVVAAAFNRKWFTCRQSPRVPQVVSSACKQTPSAKHTYSNTENIGLCLSDVFGRNAQRRAIGNYRLADCAAFNVVSCPCMRMASDCIQSKLFAQ